MEIYIKIKKLKKCTKLTESAQQNMLLYIIDKM